MQRRSICTDAMFWLLWSSSGTIWTVKRLFYSRVAIGSVPERQGWSSSLTVIAIQSGSFSQTSNLLLKLHLYSQLSLFCWPMKWELLYLISSFNLRCLLLWKTCVKQELTTNAAEQMEILATRFTFTGYLTSTFSSFFLTSSRSTTLAMYLSTPHCLPSSLKQWAVLSKKNWSGRMQMMPLQIAFSSYISQPNSCSQTVSNRKLSCERQGSSISESQLIFMGSTEPQRKVLKISLLLATSTSRKMARETSLGCCSEATSCISSKRRNFLVLFMHGKYNFIGSTGEASR